MKSKKLLDDFTRYCEAHPEQRFWQALNNWCGWPFVMVSDGLEGGTLRDTFYWEENVPPQDV